MRARKSWSRAGARDPSAAQGRQLVDVADGRRADRHRRRTRSASTRSTTTSASCSGSEATSPCSSRARRRSSPGPRRESHLVERGGRAALRIHTEEALGETSTTSVGQRGGPRRGAGRRSGPTEGHAHRVTTRTRKDGSLVDVDSSVLDRGRRRAGRSLRHLQRHQRPPAAARYYEALFELSPTAIVSGTCRRERHVVEPAAESSSATRPRRRSGATRTSSSPTTRVSARRSQSRPTRV